MSIELLTSLFICTGSIAVALAVYRIPIAAALVAFILYSVYTGLFLFRVLEWLGVVYLAVPVAMFFARYHNWTRGRMAGLVLIAVASSYGIAMLAFLPQWWDIQQMARDYPPVRMAERLPYEHKTDFRPLGVPDKAAVRDFQDYAGWYPRNEREHVLASVEMVHEDFVEAFSRQSGMGVIRMPGLSFDRGALEQPAPVPILQPPIVSDSTSAGDLALPEPLADVVPFARLNTSLVEDFADTDGFVEAEGEWRIGDPTGIRVRGFQSHGFRNVPKDSVSDGWQLARLELVSLLKHDPPAVYLSEHLPRMEELASETAPTRPLNAFETTALPQLLEGQNIVAETQGNRLRVLGGVQAAHVCTQCHNVQAGHLLGAFTYQFRRDAPAGPATPARPLL